MSIQVPGKFMVELFRIIPEDLSGLWPLKGKTGSCLGQYPVSPDISGRTWVQILLSSFNSCVTSAELLNLSEPPFPHESEMQSITPPWLCHAECMRQTGRQISSETAYRRHSMSAHTLLQGPVSSFLIVLAGILGLGLALGSPLVRFGTPPLLRSSQVLSARASC